MHRSLVYDLEAEVGYTFSPLHNGEAVASTEDRRLEAGTVESFSPLHNGEAVASGAALGAAGAAGAAYFQSPT